MWIPTTPKVSAAKSVVIARPVSARRRPLTRVLRGRGDDTPEPCVVVEPNRTLLLGVGIDATQRSGLFFLFAGSRSRIGGLILPVLNSRRALPGNGAQVFVLDQS